MLRRNADHVPEVDRIRIIVRTLHARRRGFGGTESVVVVEGGSAAVRLGHILDQVVREKQQLSLRQQEFLLHRGGELVGVGLEFEVLGQGAAAQLFLLAGAVIRIKKPEAEQGEQRSEDQQGFDPVAVDDPEEFAHRPVRSRRNLLVVDEVAHIGGQRAYACVTLCRIGMDRLVDDRLDRVADLQLRQVVAVAVGVADVAAGHDGGSAGRCRSLLGYIAAAAPAQGHDFKENHAERENIDLRRGPAVAQELRRQVVGGSAEMFRHGVQRLGAAPVHQVDFAEFAHHDVARLDVAVHDALAVAVGDHLAHLQKVFQPGDQRVLFLAAADLFVEIGFAGGFDELGERGAVDQLHHHFPMPRAVLAHRVDRDDRRMVEPGVQAAFFEEGFDRARIVPELLVQAFDRDDAVEKQVAGLADAADSPGGEVAQETELAAALRHLRPAFFRRFRPGGILPRVSRQHDGRIDFIGIDRLLFGTHLKPSAVY